jgi:hypothetical protein
MLLAAFGLKPKFLAGHLDEPANHFQTQRLCFVHADVHAPACLPFRLLLYWIKVASAEADIA